MRARTPARAIAAASLKPRPAVLAVRYNSSSPASPSTPASSSSKPSTSTWYPAIAPGASPVYDAALDYIRSHQSGLLTRLEKLRGVANPTPAQLREIDELEVEAYVNDPMVRHLYRETKGAGHMNRPVIRHMAEREWKLRGGLDLIMGRVYQNKIVPDLIPDIGPTNPLTITLSEGVVEPGLVLDCSILNQPPSITYQPFQHPSQPSSSTDAPAALYTILMVDPDTPEPDAHGFSERLHYLKTNILLSTLTGETNLTGEIADEIISYEPPAPENGSGRHRYVFFVLRQTAPLEALPAPPRERFNTREWLASNSFTTSSIVGVNLIRSEWTRSSNEYINSVWQEYRGVAAGAPEYKRGPKEERYGKPFSSIQQRAADLRQRAWERSLAEFAEVGLAEDIEDGGPEESYGFRRQEAEEEEQNLVQ